MKKTKSYKVWVHIEEITLSPDDDPTYQDVGMPNELGEFDSLPSAEVLVNQIMEDYAE